MSETNTVMDEQVELQSVTSKLTGGVMWLTGLSGSGKSTIANALHAKYSQLGLNVCVLDGDKIRQGLCSDLGFSAEDRSENVRRIGEVARLFADAGVITIVAFISPYREDREKVRKRLDIVPFMEVFVDCPLEECERRDPKGLYKRVRNGEIPKFTGISDPYEEPLQPELRLQTHQLSVSDCVLQIMDIMQKQILAHYIEKQGR